MSWWSATAGSPSTCRTGCRALGLAENLGIPAGRNAGSSAGPRRPAVLPRRRRLAAPDRRAGPDGGRLRGRSAARPDPAAGGRPRRSGRAASLDAADAGGRPRPEQPGDEHLGGRGRGAAGGVRLRGGLAGAVLVRPRGDRAGLAGVGRGLPRALRRRDRGSPPGDPADPARGVLPVPGPEPGLARPAQPALAGRAALRPSTGRRSPAPGCGRGRVWSRPSGAT